MDATLLRGPFFFLRGLGRGVRLMGHGKGALQGAFHPLGNLAIANSIVITLAGHAMISYV